jgi:hypothetical protein
MATVAFEVNFQLDDQGRSSPLPEGEQIVFLKADPLDNDTRTVQQNSNKCTINAKSVTKNCTKSVTDSDKKLTSNEKPSWKELKSIEKRRRAILKRSGEPFFQTLLSHDGTVCHALQRDPLMYITMSCYVGVRFAAYFGLPEVISDIANAGNIGIVGGFLSFFLVIFVWESMRRFDVLYRISMSCEGRIFDAAALAKSTLPKANALRLIRYMNAVHIAGYVGLSSTYTFENFFEPENRMNRQVLTPKECERIRNIDMNIGGSAYRELVTWCIAEITTAQKEGLIDGRLAFQYRELILRLRGSIGALYDYDDQPMLFSLVHLICVLSACYLPLFAISAGFEAGTGEEAYWVTDLVAGLIVALQVIFVTGLRVLAREMSDPYGDDVSDLSVMHYMNFTWTMSRRMLEAELPEPVDSIMEEQLCRESQSIGDAWEVSREIISVQHEA